MAWTYTWTAGPKGGSLTDLSVYCTSVRVLSHVGAYRRGQDIDVPYLHGQKQVAHKFAGPAVVPLEVMPRYTNSSGGITHSDGAAGHVFENLSAVKGLLYSGKTLATLRQTAPDYGTVETDVQVMSPPTEGQNRFTFVFMLQAAVPFWRSTSQTTDSSPGSMTVGGDAPIDDFWIEWVGGTNPSITFNGSDTIAYDGGAIPAGGVRVYVGEGRAERISGGADESANLTATKTYWAELNGGTTNTSTETGGSTTTVKWYDRWWI